MFTFHNMLKVDKIYKAAGWRPVYIQWVTKAIWITGVSYPVLHTQWVSIINQLHLLLACGGTTSLQYFARQSPRFCKKLFEMINVEWKGLSDLPSSDNETVDKESDEKEKKLDEEKRDVDDGETMSAADGQDNKVDTKYKDKESDWENGKEQASFRGASLMNPTFPTSFTHQIDRINRKTAQLEHAPQIIESGFKDFPSGK
ncbi:hypothetical protein DFS33DRAFT_1275319 [Desarmillaria ectypa]|nr:hypothetical protein DFS33DRAFT_1275319 [Desarmillaria ectypa]